jgi:hypothetical protein
VTAGGESPGRPPTGPFPTWESAAGKLIGRIARRDRSSAVIRRCVTPRSANHGTVLRYPGTVLLGNAIHVGTVTGLPAVKAASSGLGGEARYSLQPARHRMQHHLYCL